MFKWAKSKDEYKGKCSLWKDRLAIDGKEFTAALRNNLTELPQDIQPRNTAEKQNDNMLCFWVVIVYFPTYTKLHSRLRVLSSLNKELFKGEMAISSQAY